MELLSQPHESVVLTLNTMLPDLKIADQLPAPAHTRAPLPSTQPRRASPEQRPPLSAPSSSQSLLAVGGSSFSPKPSSVPTRTLAPGRQGDRIPASGPAPTSGEPRCPWSARSREAAPELMPGRSRDRARWPEDPPRPPQPGWARCGAQDPPGAGPRPWHPPGPRAHVSDRLGVRHAPAPTGGPQEPRCRVGAQKGWPGQTDLLRRRRLLPGPEVEWMCPRGAGLGLVGRAGLGRALLAARVGGGGGGRRGAGLPPSGPVAAVAGPEGRGRARGDSPWESQK